VGGGDGHLQERQIQAFLEDYKGDVVCSKLLHHEALGRLDEPKLWELRDINEIMNLAANEWVKYEGTRYFPKLGKQRGWERGNKLMGTNAEFVPQSQQTKMSL